MKNLTQFKRFLAENVGREVRVTNLIPDLPGYIAGVGSTSIRTLSKVQTNGFYTDFIDLSGQSRHSWVEFPKAKDIRVFENRVEFLACEKETSWGDRYRFPDPVFAAGEPWLIFEF